MRTIRFPIAGLMLAVLVVAVALAALRTASETWAGVMFLITCGVLCLAIVGVVCRDGPKRAWWLGFALFGWGYLLLAQWSTVNLPTMALLDAIARAARACRFNSAVAWGWKDERRAWAGGFGWGGGGISSDESLREIAHCLQRGGSRSTGGLLARHDVRWSDRSPAPRFATRTPYVAARARHAGGGSGRRSWC